MENFYWRKGNEWDDEPREVEEDDNPYFCTSCNHDADREVEPGKWVCSCGKTVIKNK